ncbi:MAG: nuclear transport factor 2 family protein [Balneola sp.]
MIRFSIIPLLILILSGLQNPTEEVDKFWAEVSRTVAEGDFENYSNTYHPDAVLVNGISGTSYPISNALSGWKKGFDDTKAGKVKASVEFRFSKRLHSKTTAHDTGIFKYTSQTEDSKQNSSYIHFEGLMTKANGDWKMMMEYQVSVASEEEWNGLE